MLRFDEALARILALGAPALSAEDVPLEDADGRVLGEDLLSPIDLPGFDYSAMDGYAVRTSDFTGALPFRLPVRGESRTGMVPPALASGAAMRILTGAAIPDGADAVVMQENVTRVARTGSAGGAADAGDADDALFAEAPRVGRHIRRRGEDLAAGSLALPRGTRLGAPQLALAASLDRAGVPVARRPVVAILATGDELRAPGSASAPGTIPESNTIALASMARRVGALTPPHAFVRDDRAATERAFAAALDQADVLVTVGGVSVGDHDLVRPALEAVGVVLDFWKVAIKPGKPLAIGTKKRPGRRDAIVIGLPGNPASAMITFAVFGLPLLRALQGDLCPVARPTRARMTTAHPHEPGRLELARARVSHGPEGTTVTTLRNQASGAVTTMAQADGLVLVAADSTGLAAGDEVDVLLWSELTR
jgi:molybdopterin molybdotransferase